MAEISRIKTHQVNGGNDPRDAQISDMLLSMVRSLVDEADRLELLLIGGDEGVAFQVRAAASDVGKLIGKSGRTARAVRTILAASGAKNGRRYTLDIVPGDIPGEARLESTSVKL